MCSTLNGDGSRPKCRSVNFEDGEEGILDYIVQQCGAFFACFPDVYHEGWVLSLCGNFN